MKIGYARVSTQQQNLSMQLDALNQAGCERIYEEKVTGKKEDREQLQRALDALREGDTLVVYKLDRLARSAKQLFEIADYLKKHNIDFVSIKENIDTSTPMGKAMFGMFAVFAEFERDIIAERTKEGVAAARARGRNGGRPKVKTKKIDIALMMYDSGKHSIAEILEETGISKMTLYRYIKARDAQTEPKQEN